MIIVGTVGLTFVASKRTSSADDFFVAGGRIEGVSMVSLLLETSCLQLLF